MIDLGMMKVFGEKYFFCVYIMSLIKNKKELKNDNKFGPYIDLLPKKCDNLPILYSNEDFEFLDGSPIQEQVRECQQGSRIIYKILCKQIDDFDQFSFQEYCLAMMLV
jgi:hypothetical protein